MKLASSDSRNAASCAADGTWSDSCRSVRTDGLQDQVTARLRRQPCGASGDEHGMSWLVVTTVMIAAELAGVGAGLVDVGRGDHALAFGLQDNHHPASLQHGVGAARFIVIS